MQSFSQINLLDILKITIITCTTLQIKIYPKKLPIVHERLMPHLELYVSWCSPSHCSQNSQSSILILIHITHFKHFPPACECQTCFSKFYSFVHFISLFYKIFFLILILLCQTQVVPWKLWSMVGCLVAVDVLFVTIWQIVDPLKK